MGYLSCLLMIVSILVLAACGGSSEPERSTSPTATMEAGTGAVDILLPQNGSIIYAEAIQISGRLDGAAQQFAIRLVTPDDETITETTLDTQPGDWSVELAHGYTGDPTEVEIQAVSSAGDVYDAATILLSDVSNRIEGSFALIHLPLDGDTVGGDMIPVQGRASGIAGDQLTVELVDSSNTVIDTQIVTLNNPYVIDEVPWQADLALNEATGAATIRVSAPDVESGEMIEYDRIAVVLSEAAG